MKRCLSFALMAWGVMAMIGCAPVYTMPDPEYAPVIPSAPQPEAANPGAIYSPASDIRLYEDRRARRVGDLLTIVIDESTNATKSAKTGTKKDNEFDIANPTILGAPLNLGINGKRFNLETSGQSSHAFDGEGESSQSNRLTGSITVVVHQVYPNGNLKVRGEKIIAMNQGDEFVRFHGIVRPHDIRSGNVVSSSLVADAQISYGGSGFVQDANEIGWFSRFLYKFMPY